ncbi:MAG: 4-(cytidine 5'-diphospho)-2-C-methyl-D-erythritol kinase [Muribaculaceae bacterium]|nr:4-(cytidine 5'-diphospho)-2-C-methyl-D-erythritol kinase [Muribaculaceae bacterium]
MILFPNAKINIGLCVTGKRPDGYHNLSTVMVPVGWCDILELIPGSGEGIVFHSEDDFGSCSPENNLVMKALRALEGYIGRTLPPLEVYLKKIVPMGAGLGGGSSDASFAIKGANELFGFGLSDREMAEVALKVGADCPFFIYNRPALATGIGEILAPVDISALNGLGLLIAKPRSEAVSTREAYAGVAVEALEPGLSPAVAISDPVERWRTSPLLVNGFEASVFPLRPEIGAVKERMYASGALFASMSGSGAAVYGVFRSAKMAEEAAVSFSECEVFTDTL